MVSGAREEVLLVADESLPMASFWPKVRKVQLVASGLLGLAHPTKAVGCVEANPEGLTQAFPITSDLEQGCLGDGLAGRHPLLLIERGPRSTVVAAAWCDPIKHASHTPGQHLHEDLDGAVTSAPTLAQPALPKNKERLPDVLLLGGASRHQVERSDQNALGPSCPPRTGVLDTVHVQAQDGNRPQVPSESNVGMSSPLPKQLAKPCVGSQIALG
jgi:hypothetical protein